jgi:hypothetical protein
MKSLLPDPANYDLARQLQACHSKRRRNGKVARLPFDLRAEINRMLDDGLPYKVIIQELGAAGEHLKEDNLSSWRLGGYQDYLKSQAINDRAHAQTEAAAEIVRDSGHPDPSQLREVCTTLALLQYLGALMDHGETLAKNTFKKNPAKMITLMNACCNLNNSALASEKRKSPRPQHLPSIASAKQDSASTGAAINDAHESSPNPSEPDRT